MMRTPLQTCMAAPLALLAILLVVPASRADQTRPVITVTTWNIEHLGTLGRGFGGGYGGFGRGAIPEDGAVLNLRTDADLEKIASLIQNTLKSDVLAIQEVGITGIVRGRSVSEPLKKIVASMNQSGDRWAYFLPQVDETPAEDAEDNTYLGFLWNMNRVRLHTVFEMSLPNIGMAGKDLFERIPLVGYFEPVTTDEAPANDFALVNVHLASGQTFDENHLIAMTLIESALARDLAKHAVMESDVIILGDFNDNPSQTRADGSPMYSPAMHAHMRFKGYINLVSPDIKTTRMNNRLDSLIDHILVNRSAQADLVHTNATTYRPGKGDGDPSKYAQWRQTFSDHFPLSFQLKVGQDNDSDFFE